METPFPDLKLPHYRIVAKLGAGGMGEVFLAEDSRLNRKVALKILSGGLALDADHMRRFVQEAKAASALNHPNIITIYEVGETETQHFIAAEYVSGETLRKQLANGPMPLESVLDAATQMASALAAAHDASIIHRDIKPENVMVRPDGLVKLLDFGIAKVAKPAIDSASEGEAPTIKTETSPGMIIGTAAYMSPEQAKGQLVDARTDLFSFGAVLYEMLTARRAFSGATPLDVIGAILYKQPAPIRQIVPGLPAEVEDIVDKLLRKDCDERYQTAADVLADLKALRKGLELRELKLMPPSPPRPRTEDSIRTLLATAQTQSSAEYLFSEIKKRKVGVGILAIVVLLAAAGVLTLRAWRRSPAPLDNAPITSIAVLPFQNKSADPETEYLSDGLAESLIFGLSQLPDLKVSPTSSVFRYKNKDMDASKIGSELGVSAVLTGRVAQRGDDLSLSVELVDVRNNKLLWGKQYDRKLADLLTTQREIAGEITQNLKLKLSGADERRVTRHYAKNAEAYQLYLKGHYHSSKYTKEGFNQGIDYFNQAIASDPNFALAYSGLAFCYMNQTDWVFAPKDSVPKARQAVENALRIDDTLAEAHTMLAMIRLQYDWDWPGAEVEFRRALELDPNYALGHSFLAWHLAAMGRFEEAVGEDKRALTLDPMSAAVNADLGWDLYLARRYDEAIEQLRKATELQSNYWVSHVLLGRCYEQKGRVHEAVEQFQKARQIENSIPEVLAALGHGFGLAGRKAEALKIISELQERSKKEFVPSYAIATIYIGLGMKEEAMQELVKSYTEGSFYMIHLKVEPILDPLRADPRFADVMRRVGHTP